MTAAMRSGARAVAVVLALGLAATVGPPAQATFLRNGLRPGGPGTPGFQHPPPPGAPVRIRPPGEPAVQAARTPGPRQARFRWFWRAVSPEASATGAARWAEALGVVQAHRARGQGLFAPATLGAIRASWGAEIRAAARARDLSEALLLAVIAVESGGDAHALSPKGAQGLMQLIPATARRFGVRNAFAPAANIAGGAAYLDWLLGEFDGDIVLALAGYNAGEGAVRRHGGVPPYPETRAYIVRVFDAIAAAAGFCTAPPAGPRRSCRREPEARERLAAARRADRRGARSGAAHADNSSPR